VYSSANREGRKIAWDEAVDSTVAEAELVAMVLEAQVRKEAWVELGGVVSFMSATNAIRRISDAWRGRRIYLEVWSWMERVNLSMELGGIRYLGHIES
jgi:hypothetical protein